MRHPVRPFITAYKGRSAKSSTARSLAALAASVDEKPRPKPAPLRLEEPAPAPASHDEAYLAALRAADAVFGRLGVPPAAPQPAPKSEGPSGRILPSLLQEERAAVRFEEEPSRKRGRKKRDASALDLTPAPERAPRSPRSRRQPAGFDAARKVEPAESPRLADGKLDGAKVERAGAEAAKFFRTEPTAATAAGEFAPAGSGEDRERRARRPIQRRWVLKTELQPGEKWKRRMRHATR